MTMSIKELRIYGFQTATIRQVAGVLESITHERIEPHMQGHDHGLLGAWMLNIDGHEVRLSLLENRLPASPEDELDYWPEYLDFPVLFFYEGPTDFDDRALVSPRGLGGVLLSQLGMDESVEAYYLYLNEWNPKTNRLESVPPPKKVF
jgi:hypothetical protein